MPAFRAKPPQGSLLQRGDPLAKGLVAAYMVGESAGTKVYDGAQGLTATTVNAPPRSAGRYGTGLSLTAASSQYAAVAGAGDADAPPGLKITGAFSMALLFGLTTTGTFSGCGRGQSLGSAGGSCYYLSPFGTALYGGVSNGTTVTTASGGTLAAGGTYLGGVTFDATGGLGGLRVYLDGRQVASASPSFTTLRDPSDKRFWMGGTADQTEGLLAINGRIDLCLVWSGRVLTAADWRALAADPFRMFRRRYVPVPVRPAADGGVSGSLSATLDALTCAVTATASVAASTSATLAACTLAGTGAAAVAASLTATLGTAVCAGTGAAAVAASLSATLDAATLAGTGTVGTASASGTLSATLAACTLAGTAAVPATAALSATLGACTLAATVGDAAVATRFSTWDVPTRAATWDVPARSSTWTTGA